MIYEIAFTQKAKEDVAFFQKAGNQPSLKKISALINSPTAIYWYWQIRTTQIQLGRSVVSKNQPRTSPCL